jgi:hypothetical protein
MESVKLPRGSVHVVTTRRQGRHQEYVANLLMQSYRQDGKVKKLTIANLSHLPDECIELIRGSLAGEQYVKARDHFKIERALPHGHVEAVLAMIKRLDLPKLLDRKPGNERDLVLAMIAQRIIEARVERAFRTLKQSDLEIRPIYHYLESRVRAHVLICMLAYYVEWHLRAAWAELLFVDSEPPLRSDPVGKAEPSASALRKAQTQRDPQGLPIHSFRTLMNELALRTRNTVRIGDTPGTFSETVEPSAIQARALALIAQLPIAT